MIAIIKYNAGNVASVKNAVNRLGYECIITDDNTEILKADKVILPGVGEASSAMTYLIERGLDKTIIEVKKPLLGICLGMQLMCEFTEEGNTKGLGIFKTNVKLFPPEEIVPHMGWNNFISTKGELFRGIKKDDDVYFIHSYYAEPNLDSVADCDYILCFSAAMQKNNFYGTQFHPEKSSEIGGKILKNFLEL